jgi:hypothetical protein
MLPGIIRLRQAEFLCGEGSPLAIVFSPTIVVWLGKAAIISSEELPPTFQRCEH